MTELGWRSLSGEELEREYSPSSCLPDGDYRPFVAAYRTRSENAWALVEAHPDIATFELVDESVKASVVGAIPTSPMPVPLLVFIHGGYWQELSVAHSLFAAADCIDRGWAFAAVEYTLAPEANIDQIVEECRWAVRELIAPASTLGIDPQRIVVAGSSAGAHLAAMVASDIGSLLGTVLVSGVYDLEPLLATSINEAVGMDASAAARNSPLHLIIDRFPSSVIAVGSNETSEFKAQSSAFAGRLESAGVEVKHVEIENRNHFDVILELAAPNTTLGEAVADLIDSERG